MKGVKPPVERGREYNIEITGLGHSGEGVGKYEGFTVFVQQALPQDEVEVRIVEVNALSEEQRHELFQHLLCLSRSVDDTCRLHGRLHLRVCERIVHDAILRGRASRRAGYRL